MDRASLIFKVLSGKAGSIEKQKLEFWIAQSKANQDEFDDIKLLWEHSVIASDHSEDDRGFQKIRERIQHGIQKKKRIRFILYACILIIVGVIFFLLLKETWFSNSEVTRFDSTGMQEVVKMLEHNYHIEIEVRNPNVLKCDFTATLYRIKDMQAVFSSIEYTLNVKFIAEGKYKYSLMGDGCPSL